MTLEEEDEEYNNKVDLWRVLIYELYYNYYIFFVKNVKETILNNYKVSEICLASAKDEFPMKRFYKLIYEKELQKWTWMQDFGS